MIRERRLVTFARFRDVLSADSLVAFLASHGVDAHVEGADPLSIGIGGRVRVVLAEDDVRRARWTIENAGDAQAWLHATSDLDPSAELEPFPDAGRKPAPPARRATVVLALALLIALLAAVLVSR